MNVQQMQAEAMREGLEAKRDFEIAEQQRKVEALIDQTKDRLDHLSRYASDVAYAVSRADQTPLAYPAGAFGHDTETIDGLLVTLSEESSVLANMLAAKEKTTDLQSKYEALVTEAVEAQKQANGADQPVTVPSGQYL